jgi:DNA modification methylase
VFQLGSEVIKDDSSFQKYRGKVDMVFTSPPYFAKEKYSMDPEQSCIKFSQYEAWRDGFLRPTLETAVEWLRRDRYLLWNIADAKFGGDMLSLEEDSKQILLSLGMEYKGVLKMSLAQMPGGNRLDSETGLPKAKNFCKVNGLWLKYEPIFVFYKK